DIEVDTMVFAIGDVADPTLGLPYNKDCYVTNPHPEDPQQPGYQVLDPQVGQIMDGVFVVGWARKASEGLVGIARHDGEVGAAEVVKYLQTASDRDSASYDEIVRRLASKNLRLVTKPELELLSKAEEREGKTRAIQYFKFSDDEAMLAAIDEQKTQTA